MAISTATINTDIDRTVSLLLQTTSNALTGKLEELEAEKATVSRFLLELEQGHIQKMFTQEEVKAALDRVRTMLKERALETTKALVQKFVAQVVVKPEEVVVQFNFFPDFTMKLDIEKDCPATERLTHVQGQSPSLGCDFGGERGNKIRVFPMNQGVLQKITPPCKAIEKTGFFDHFQSSPSSPKSARFSFLHLQRVKIV